jgi:hypothetical protein
MRRKMPAVLAAAAPAGMLGLGAPGPGTDRPGWGWPS